MNEELEEGEVALDSNEPGVQDDQKILFEKKKAKKRKQQNAGNKNRSPSESLEKIHKKVKTEGNPIHKRVKHEFTSSTYKTKPCEFYRKGACQKGNDCTFSHDFEVEKLDSLCKFYLTGNCHKGDSCPFSHDLKRYPCKYFFGDGGCKAGPQCKFSHELPYEKQKIINFIEENENHFMNIYQTQGRTNLGNYFMEFLQKKNAEQVKDKHLLLPLIADPNPQNPHFMQPNPMNMPPQNPTMHQHPGNLQGGPQIYQGKPQFFDPKTGKPPHYMQQGPPPNQNFQGKQFPMQMSGQQPVAQFSQGPQTYHPQQNMQYPPPQGFQPQQQVQHFQNPPPYMQQQQQQQYQYPQHQQLQQQQMNPHQQQPQHFQHPHQQQQQMKPTQPQLYQSPHQQQQQIMNPHQQHQPHQFHPQQMQQQQQQRGVNQMQGPPMMGQNFSQISPTINRSLDQNDPRLQQGMQPQNLQGKQIPPYSMHPPMGSQLPMQSQGSQGQMPQNKYPYPVFEQSQGNFPQQAGTFQNPQFHGPQNPSQISTSANSLVQSANQTPVPIQYKDKIQEEEKTTRKDNFEIPSQRGERPPEHAKHLEDKSFYSDLPSSKEFKITSPRNIEARSSFEKKQTKEETSKVSPIKKEQPVEEQKKGEQDEDQDTGRRKSFWNVVKSRQRTHGAGAQAAQKAEMKSEVKTFDPRLVKTKKEVPKKAGEVKYLNQSKLLAKLGLKKEKMHKKNETPNDMEKLFSSFEFYPEKSSLHKINRDIQNTTLTDTLKKLNELLSINE